MVTARRIPGRPMAASRIRSKHIMLSIVLAAVLLMMMYTGSVARTLSQRGQGRDGANCQDDSDCDFQYTCSKNNNAAFCVNTPALTQASAPLQPAPAPQQGLSVGAVCTVGAQQCASPLNCVDMGTGAGPLCQ